MDAESSEDNLPSTSEEVSGKLDVVVYIEREVCVSESAEEYLFVPLARRKLVIIQGELSI